MPPHDDDSPMRCRLRLHLSPASSIFLGGSLSSVLTTEHLSGQHDSTRPPRAYFRNDFRGPKKRRVSYPFRITIRATPLFQWGTLFICPTRSLPQPPGFTSPRFRLRILPSAFSLYPTSISFSPAFLGVFIFSGLETESASTVSGCLIEPEEPGQPRLFPSFSQTLFLPDYPRPPHLLGRQKH